MRTLRRNMTDFEYLPYDGTETDLDAYGLHTGEFHPVYGTAVPLRGNISTPSGYTNQTFYGTDARYTHVLVMDKPKNTEINELGIVLWNGDEYEVRAVRPSLNSLSVALRKTTKNNGEPYEPDPEPGPEGETGATGATGANGETGGTWETGGEGE